MILLPWTRQPVGPVEPNWSDTRLAQASGLWRMEHAASNLITGEPTVLTGSAYYGVGPSGQIARTLVGTNRVQLASDSRNLVPTSGGFTVALHYRKLGAAAATAGFGCDATAIASNRAGTHFPFSDGTLYWDFGGNVSGTERLTAAGLTYGDDFWVFNTGPRGMEIWQNGIRRSSQASSANWNSTSNAYLLGMHGTATQADDAECAVFLTAQRQWSPAECASWTAQGAWSVFRPQVLYVKAGSGGSTLTKTATLDAAIQEAKTATATLDAAIRQTNTNTATLDGVIATRNTTTVTLDAAIRQAVTATVTLDAAIRATIDTSSTLDAVIQNAGVNTYTATATIDAAIREAKALTATLDAAIQIANTKTVTLDGVIVSVNTKTATLDATIQVAATLYALLDAYIFDADAPVVVPDTRQTPAGKAKQTRNARRRYIMPDDTIVMATPDEAEQLVKLFVKPKPVKKVSKQVVKELRKVDLVEFEPQSSDTVETEKIVVKARKAVWEPQADVYEKAMKLLVDREIKRRRHEEELILLAA